MAVTNFDDKTHAAGKFRDAVNRRLGGVLGIGIVELPVGPTESEALLVAYFDNSDQYTIHFADFSVAANFILTRRHWGGLPVAIFPTAEAALEAFDPALALEKGIAVPINK